MRAVTRCARALGGIPARRLNGLASLQQRRPLPRPKSAITRCYTTAATESRFQAQPRDNAARHYSRSRNGDSLFIEVRGTESPRWLPAAILRDACPQSRSPSSGNKSFATSEIPLDISIKSVFQNADGDVEVHWENDIPRFAQHKHMSTFTLEDLKLLEHSGTGKMMHSRPRRPFGNLSPLLWDASALEHRGVLRITYDDWLAGGDTFNEALAELELTGLVFVVDVPQTKQAVVDLGLRFGALHETFYGRTWDVKSKPQAENVAYTSEYLGLHSDMLYLETPPKLQLLHCLENDAEGGSSLFCDGRRIGTEMIQFHAEKYSGLNRPKVTYHYDANGFFYEQGRHVFNFDPSQKFPTFTNLWWSPPFQGRFARPRSSLSKRFFDEWHAGAVHLQSLIDDPANVYRHRLKAGECAVFDNHRVLHGREAFDPSTGGRHLHGTYVHQDEWKSMTRRIPQHILRSRLKLPTPGPRNARELRDSLMWKYPGAPTWEENKVRINQERRSTQAEDTAEVTERFERAFPDRNDRPY